MLLRIAALLTTLLSLAIYPAAAQQAGAPFAEEIAAFSQADRITPPPKGGILFVGSSSIRLWPALEKDFPKHRVLNRGFGGASIPDVARYAQETIYRYQPRQVVFYCGENDLAASDTITAATVTSRFTALFTDIRKQLPRAGFVYISIKPSPSRRHLIPKIEAANKAIRSFLATHPNTRFVDVYTPMLGHDGNIKSSLFTADSLHMNPSGYAVWKTVLKPVLR